MKTWRHTNARVAILLSIVTLAAINSLPCRAEEKADSSKYLDAVRIYNRAVYP